MRPGGRRGRPHHPGIWWIGWLFADLGVLLGLVIGLSQEVTFPTKANDNVSTCPHPSPSPASAASAAPPGISTTAERFRVVMTDQHDCAPVDALWTDVRKRGRPGLALLFGAPLKAWPEAAGQRLSEGAVTCLRNNPAFSEAGVVLRPFLQYVQEGKTGYGWLDVDVYYYGA